MSELHKTLLKKAEKIAKEYLKEATDIEAIVVGGSLARKFSDKQSDIEMYVYYQDALPKKEVIHKILRKLNAKTVRSNNVHWFHPAWGYHTFFVTEGIKVELGYRKISDITERINKFISGNILSKQGIHDTPFGHYESGLASCISECIPVYDRGFIASTKALLDPIPTDLKKLLLTHYFDDANTVANVKLKQAVERNDHYQFNSCMAFIIRGIVITIFALNNKYFPGDKWNEKYLSGFTILPENYHETMRSIMSEGEYTQQDKERKYKCILRINSALAQLIEA